MLHTRWKVEAERRHNEHGQIDLLLTTADRHFAIYLENKPLEQTIDQSSSSPGIGQAGGNQAAGQVQLMLEKLFG